MGQRIFKSEFIRVYFCIKFLPMDINTNMDEYLEMVSKRLEEESKNRTPEESLRIFVKLGILDEEGNVMEGYEGLVWYFDNYPAID